MSSHPQPVRARLEGGPLLTRAAAGRARALGVPAARGWLACLLVAGPPLHAAMAQAPAAAPVATRSWLADSAVARSPALAALRATVAAAEARARASGFGAPAALAVEAEQVPDGADLTRAGSARLYLERAFQPAGLATATRQVAASDVARASVRLAAVTRAVAIRADALADGAAAWLAVGRRLEASDSLLASAEASLRTRFAVGDARYVDVLRLRTERLRTRSARAAAETERETRRAALLGVLGVGEAERAAWLVRVDSALAALAAAGPRAVPPLPSADSLLVLAPARALADAARARAEAEQRRARAARGRRLSASLGIERFLGAEGTFRVGPVATASVSLPFTAGRANRAGAAADELAVRAAAEDVRAVEVAERARIAVAIRRVESVQRRLALFDAALLRGAEQEREAALAAFRAGQLTLLELLDFERALLDADIARLRATADLADAYAEALTGGLLDAAPEPIPFLAGAPGAGVEE